MAVKNLIDGVREAMHEEMARDPRVVLLGEDVGIRGGVFRASEGLVGEFGEARVIDAPLGESGIAGVAIGMALNGLRPIAEMQFADFIHPAFNQIVSEAAKIRYRSNNDFHVPMVIRAPFGGGVHGALYHSQSVEAFFMHVPGLKIVVPSTPADAKGLLKSAIRDEDPVMYFEHKRTYRLVRGEIPDGDFTVPIGKARTVREGKDLSIFAYGLMAVFAEQAALELEKEGVSAEVIDLRTLLPLDREAILSSIGKTHRGLVVYEANRTMGAGAEVAALIAEEALFELDAPVRRLAGPDLPAMPFNTVQEEHFMPNPEKIVHAARELLAS
ncbi:MAG: alpha-ketoacid dehydrogenase subunit beta [Thermaerobacter sp.]|nr:alpha-ketoacid dehydrogenase subunit beta [Thermaerobacter sp.]